MTTHQIELSDVIIDVTGTYYNGSFGNYETPPEPREFEIEKLEICGIDVTEPLDDKLNEIESLVIDKNYS